MKPYFKIVRRAAALLLTGCAGILSGCDFLVKDVPNKTIEDEWWQTYGQLNSFVTAIYRYVPSGVLDFDARDPADGDRGKARGNQRIEQEGLTDNCIGSANYVDYTYFDTGMVPTNDQRSVTQIWEIKWSAIRRACRFLENYRRAMITEAKLAEVTRLAAEVRALRAYFHMELFLYYGEIPIVKTTTLAADQNLARQPREEIVRWILEEFEMAAEELPTRGSGNWVGSEPWRFTKGACHAWMSYLCLYEGDWENAKKWAAEVIDSNAYELFYSSKSTDHYSTLFIVKDDPEENKETIFMKNGGMKQARVRLAGSAGQSGGPGQTVISPTASLVNEYELADGRTLAELSEDERETLIKNPKAMPRDPRLTASIYFPLETYLGVTRDPWTEGGTEQVGKTNSTTTGYWVKKWSSEYTWKTSGDETGKNDFYLMRYAVVLLNYAEAAIELNQLDDEHIYTYLDAIRARAGMPAVDRTKYATREKLRELVRRERRVELAFEGHRLMDIRRWRIAKEVMNGPVYGAYDTKKREMHIAKTRTFNDRDYLWPIPADEMVRNSNMVQNPGY